MYFKKTDLEFIDKVVKLSREYESLTCNTNTHFRVKLSKQLASAEADISYKFNDFITFLSDAEAFSRLNKA